MLAEPQIAVRHGERRKLIYYCVFIHILSNKSIYHFYFAAFVEHNNVEVELLLFEAISQCQGDCPTFILPSQCPLIRA